MNGRLRQLVIGLVALPLSAIPFIGYGNLTPEGRLVRDRAMVALNPPTLPVLSARRVAAIAAAAPRYEGAVMALAYHGIGSTSDGEGGYVIPPGRFAEHLATLQAAGMQTVTAAQVAEAFTGGPALPPNAVMISFDDGRSDAMLFADPLLAQARMAATMFVITGAASKPGIYYASWDQLGRYARSGRWDLQAHTADLHREQKVAGGGRLPALTSLQPGESLVAYRDRVRADLGRAAEALERHTDRSPQAFAYPFGAYGADRANHPGIRQVLAEEVARRFPVAFHQDEQETVPLLDGGGDLLGLRRLEVEDWSGMELLRRIGDAAARRRGEAPVPPPTLDDPGLDELVAPDLGAGELAAPVPAPLPGAALWPLPAVAPPATAPAPAPPAPRAPVAPVAPVAIAVPVTSPPASSPPSTGTIPTTTLPPPTTTTTVRPRPVVTTTTSTTTPSTTTTTTPGCRSRGQGSVCRP